MISMKGEQRNINLCYICKRERRFHIDYVEEDYMNNGRKLLGSNIVEGINKMRNSLKNEDISSKSLETCLICLDSFNSEEGNLLECGHFCCDNCMYNYLKTEILSAKVAKLLCFVEDCDYELTEQFITLKIKEDQFLLKSSLVKIKSSVLNQIVIVIFKKI